MSESPAQIKVEELIRVSVIVPKTHEEAVLAAISSVTQSLQVGTPESSAPQLSIVPEVSVPQLTDGPVGKPASRKASPADLAKLVHHPAVRVISSSVSVSSSTTERPQAGVLAKRAPSASERVEFKLGYVSGSPTELKALADRVLGEMDWLIELMPDPDFVRKGLNAISDKTTGNPNHRALVELSHTQEELARQEKFFARQMAAWDGKSAAQATSKPPANNGYAATRRVLSDDEQAKADAQSVAALAAKKIVIGRPNQQGTVANRGNTVPGVGGGGSRKVRQGRKGAKK